MFVKKSAFTLIELLIVVAIIAILAAIALPNFLEAQTRSKVSRAKSDLRTLATALEAYNVDNNCYLPVPFALGPRFRRMRPLTTPISYITTIPLDPFESTDPNGEGNFRRGLYSYGATPIEKASRWALASDGPDRNESCDGLVFYPGYSPSLFDGTNTEFKFVRYDPTNGTISRGDILRMSDYRND